MAQERELIDIRDGKEVYAYQDGSKRYANGHFVEAPPYKAPTITKDTASELATRRWDMVREAAANGAMRATKSDYEAEAVERIAHAQSELAINTKKGRDSTGAAKFVFQAAGWLRPREAGPQVQINQVVLPQSVLRLLAARHGSGDSVPEDGE